MLRGSAASAQRLTASAGSAGGRNRPAAESRRLRGCGARRDGQFLGDRLIASGALGGIRLKYESVWEGLLLCGGLSLMLIGAWLTASPI
ncbi:MAG: hypothetical protein ACLS7Z_00420 [Christensenellales bacterium]